MHGNFGAEELPAAVTLVCDACGRPVTTRVSGNTTRCPERVTLACDACGHRWRTRAGEGGTVRCPECSHAHRIQAGCGATLTVPAGSTRPPVTLNCYACGHQWDTRAREGGTVRCPECRHPRRVPTGARDHITPAPSPTRRAPARRTGRPTERPATPPREGRGFFATLRGLFPPVDSTPAGQGIDCLHCGHEWTTTAAPGNAVRCPECRRMRRIPTGPAQPRRRVTPTPTPARPAAPRTATPRPRPEPAPSRTAPGPIDTINLPRAEAQRRDRVCIVVRSLTGFTGLLVAYNQPLGCCEAMEVHQVPERQRCPRTATHAVQYQQGASLAHAYTCPRHAEPLAALAQNSAYTATVHRLNGPPQLPG